MPEPILSVRGLKVHFQVKAEPAWPWTPTQSLRAVDGVSFELHAGETLGIVGESGCGKSTLARAILNLIPVTEGEIAWMGKTIEPDDKAAWQALRRDMQIIFQDPLASLDPRMTVARIIAEPLRVHRPELSDAQVMEKVRAVMAEVGLTEPQINRYPHEFSGGQCQRIGIARALVLEPKLIVCDEPVSALDVSIQAQIINLLMDLQDEMKLSYLFVAHDLAVVEHISHRVAVMYLGRIVEMTDRASLFETPLHPYTEALLSAVPIPKASSRQKKRVILTGDVPSPINPPAGCHFHTRCPYAHNRCRTEVPALREVKAGHVAACHLHDAGPMVPMA